MSVVMPCSTSQCPEQHVARAATSCWFSFNLRLYRSTGTPRMIWNPRPWETSAAIFLSLAPNVGSGNASLVTVGTCVGGRASCEAAMHQLMARC